MAVNDTTTETGKGKDMGEIIIDGHGNNREVVAEFVRAMEMEGNWLGENPGYTVPSLDEIE